MSNLTLRTVKDSPLTNQEVDNNFVTLNTDKHENGSSPSYQNITAVSLSATGTVTGSNLNVSNWNTAYSWGDHAAAGYLSSASLDDYATEIYVNTQISNLVDTAPTTLDTLNELAAALGDDPNFATTVSSSIGTKWTQDNTKISNWDTAYSWGNHASAGYLTSYTESDPTVPAHVKSITTIEKTNWNTAYGWGDHSAEGYLTTYTETDPTVPAHVKSITTTEKSNWNTAYAWGDHSAEGYLTTYVETDPTVPAHVKLITETQKANWNTAYGWGDHSAEGYLTTYTETDPTVPAHVKSITTTEKSNWNTAYAWGDHSAEGYLTTYVETDPTVPAHVKLITETQKANWNTAYGWGNHASAGYLTGGSIDVTEVTAGSVVLGGSGTIGGTTWANGEFHLGSSSSGWAMDLNEFYNSGTAIIGTLAGNLSLNPAGTLTIKGATPWTTANDGSGSGLDADTVDGIQGASLARSDIAQTFNGVVTIGGTSVSGGEGGELRLTHAPTTSLAGSSVIIDMQTSSLRVFEDASPFRGAYIDLTTCNSQSKIWHDGNDGSGSGLDADLLDGVQGTSFLRSDQADIASQRIQFSANNTNSWDTIATASASQGAFEVFNDGSGTDAFMAFHVGNDYACYFGLDGGINDIAVGGWSMGANSYRIWHQGNDGSGSGLDADTLDGLQPNVNASNNTIVQRSSSGYIFANYFNTTPNDVSSGVTKVCVETGNDGYIRHGTPDAIASFLDSVSGGSVSNARNNGAVNYVYNAGTATPTRGSCGTHIYHQWNSSLVLNLTSSTWQQGDVVVVKNVRGAVNITVNASIIYLPTAAGGSDTSVTFNGKVGSFTLIKYNTTTGQWMVGPQEKRMATDLTALLGGGGGGIKSVQRGITNMSSVSYTAIETITAVNLSKSFVTTSCAPTQTGDNTNIAQARLYSSTEVYIYNAEYQSGTLVAWEVIEFE